MQYQGKSKGYFSICLNEWKYYSIRDFGSYFKRVILFYLFIGLFDKVFSNNFKYAMVDGFLLEMQRKGLDENFIDKIMILNEEYYAE